MNYVVCFFTLFLFISCISTDEGSKNQLHQNVKDDSFYMGVLDQQTRTRSVRNNFKFIHKIHFTCLSQEFMGSFEKRHLNLMSSSQNLIKQEEGQLVFFASILASEYSYGDLSNSNQWVVTLNYNKQKIFPQKIR